MRRINLILLLALALVLYISALSESRDQGIREMVGYIEDCTLADAQSLCYSLFDRC